MSKKNNERLSEVSENRPCFFVVARKGTLETSSSSLTGSDASSEEFPGPKTKISLPYAQLCLDPKTNALITIMESGGERKSDLLRVIGHLDDEVKATVNTGIPSLSNVSFETEELWEVEENSTKGNKSRCGESLRKLLVKSHSSIFAFGARHKMLFANMEYTSLD